jgi:hypothetical protein
MGFIFPAAPEQALQDIKNGFAAFHGLYENSHWKSGSSHSLAHLHGLLFLKLQQWLATPYFCHYQCSQSVVNKGAAFPRFSPMAVVVSPIGFTRSIICPGILNTLQNLPAHITEIQVAV